MCLDEKHTWGGIFPTAKEELKVKHGHLLENTMCPPTPAHDFARPSGCQVDVTRSSSHSFAKHSHPGNNVPQGTVRGRHLCAWFNSHCDYKTHGVMNAAHKLLHLISRMCIRLGEGEGRGLRGLLVSRVATQQACFSWKQTAGGQGGCMSPAAVLRGLNKALSRRHNTSRVFPIHEANTDSSLQPSRRAAAASFTTVTPPVALAALLK